MKGLESYQKGLDLLYDSEDPWEISRGMMHVAVAHRLIGNLRECLHYVDLGLETLGPSGDPILISYMKYQRGFALMFLGQSEEAMRTVEELISSPTWTITLDETASIPGLRGIARFHAGLYEEARPLIEQAVSLLDREENRFRFFFPWILDLIYLSTGDYASLRLGPDMSAEDRAGLERTTHQYDVRLDWGMLDLLHQDWTQAELDLQSFFHHREEASSYDMMGLALSLLGFTAYRLGDLPLARERLIASLENGLKQGYYLVFCWSLGVLALILAEAGQLEPALELYATATSHPGAGNSRWFEDVLGKPVACLVEGLPAETAQAAQARGRSMTLSQAGEKYLAMLKAVPDLLAFASSKSAP